MASPSGEEKKARKRDSYREANAVGPRSKYWGGGAEIKATRLRDQAEGTKTEGAEIERAKVKRTEVKETEVKGLISRG